VTPRRLDRRTVLRAGAVGGLVVASTGLAASGPALVRAGRPELTHGVQSGDVATGSGLVWTRADRPSRMVVEVADNPDLRGGRRFAGPLLTPDTDFTGRLRVPVVGRTAHYRVTAEDLEGRTAGAPLTGSFRTPPVGREPVRFLWSGDICGQGFGINPDIGGMRIFATMAQRDADFFLCSGDTVYADGPLAESFAIGERTWRNLLTPAKSKVAETVEEFRGQYAYNLLDDNMRAFTAGIAQLNQWDDHEVVNNWYPGEVLHDEKWLSYTERRVDVLAAHAYQAFHEWVPLDPRGPVDGRVYRRFPYGPDVEVFVIDMRSHRDPNTANTGPSGEILGAAQAQWLVEAMASSTATWKVVAADLPIGRLVTDVGDTYDSVANGVGGPPSGRETEFAWLLRSLRDRGVHNVVWLTADVHYSSAHHYSPERAVFTEFEPFWEFVSGPLNAGAFVPAGLDPTFGPQEVFVHAGAQASTPLDGFQHFGEVEVAPGGDELRVTLRGQDGGALWSTSLTPVR
jgi:alkaline phosphatase D